MGTEGHCSEAIRAVTFVCVPGACVRLIGGGRQVDNRCFLSLFSIKKIISKGYCNFRYREYNKSCVRYTEQTRLKDRALVLNSVLFFRR